jgi:ABC-type cobalamin/Fe3+-siderophores transport system ATPase subunit
VKFSKLTKTNIFRSLISVWTSVANNETSNQAMQMLESVWDLSSMVSSDTRYKDAHGDIVQHFFNNSDWELDYLFVERLQVLDDATDFKKFIEVMLAPEYHSDGDYLTGLSAQVDTELSRDKLRLVIEEYTDMGLPRNIVYEVDDANDLPVGVLKNSIPFYVLKDQTINPKEAEYFKLSPVKGWNDYGVISIFEMQYYNNGFVQAFGRTKIIHREENSAWELLPDKFYQLGDEYCSLSSREEYYFSLLNAFKLHGLISILFALQDAAYFSDIHDRYSKNSNFKDSLIRSDVAERLLRELRPKLNGADLDNLYSFDYRFKPAFSEIDVKIPFDFNNMGELPNRIFAVIGKNGTGKTQLMNKLPNSFAKDASEDFYNKIPSFSKIISVSYSVFDNEIIPKKNASFNYVYCGLKDGSDNIRSSRGLVLSFHHNWKRIEELGRTEKWRSILKNFIDKDVINGFIRPKEAIPGEFQVSIEGFNAVKNKLSSGQSILLYIITQVVANIRLDSLILYDEPETHLHPNAIVDLMNTIYELVDEFESYCLIATHSPIVIRELFSKNVFVIERINNTPSVKRIGIESFGENLGVLTDEVFGDKEASKQYKTIIRKLIRQKKSFEEIVELMEFDEVPLSLNARIFIKALIRGNEKR